MGFTQSLIPWLLGTAISVFVCRKIFVYVKLQQAMRRNGCLPPPKYAHKEPILGLDMFFNQFKAMKRGDTGATERERFRKYGKTFVANSWGTTCIHTMDVTNIQAILVQLFDKFGVEPMRLHVGQPFIGKGVFSTDGPYWRFSRELIKPMFARAQVANLDALDVHLSRTMERIPYDGSMIDLQTLLKLMVR